MRGTLVNAAAVIAGSLIGLCIKKGLNDKIQETVTYMLGITTCVIGVNGILSTMITVDSATGQLSSSGEILLLVSLAIGAAIGELLRIEDALERLGDRIEKKLGASDFSKGFVSASLLFCVGAMTIIGSINDGLYHDSTVLYIKSSLDFIAALVMASTMGVGVMFAAVTVLLYQGALSLGAGFLQGVLTGDLRNQVCMVGYAIVLCIGVNFFGKIKIRTGNLVPALLIPVVYNVLMMLKILWQ